MSTNSVPRFDCAIIGAGPVGSALALWLARKTPQPQRIALLDRAPSQAGTHDPRTLALSAGSLMLLEQIIPLADLPGADITQVQVSQRGRFGRTQIHAADLGVPRLGQVVRYADLMRALAPALQTSGVTLLYDTPVTALEDSSASVKVHTHTESWDSAFLVHAEGSVSEHTQTRRDYQQSAVIAEVTVEMASNSYSRISAGTAFECFTASGPIALLPAPPEAIRGAEFADERTSQPGFAFKPNCITRRYALVWCVAPAQAQHLLALDNAAFCAQLQTAFGDKAGRFDAVSARQAYPLHLKQSLDTAPRRVSLGNAAQTLHPVAGQGLNLGLRDAYTLARLWPSTVKLNLNTLEASAERGGTVAGEQALGLAQLAQQFRAARRNDRGLFIHGTDLLARAFTWRLPGLPVAQTAGAALTLLDLCPPLRRTLARQLMLGWRV